MTDLRKLLMTLFLLRIEPFSRYHFHLILHTYSHLTLLSHFVLLSYIALVVETCDTSVAETFDLALKLHQKLTDELLTDAISKVFHHTGK